MRHAAMCFPWENTLAFVNPHTKVKDHRMVVFYFGRGTKARTLDTRFWRPLLYQLSYTPKWCMFDSAVRIYSESSHAGAGDGNRTRTASLEGWNSTIELHPQNQRLIIVSHGWVRVKRFLIFLPLFRRTFGAYGQCSSIRPQRGKDIGAQSGFRLRRQSFFKFHCDISIIQNTAMR